MPEQAHLLGTQVGHLEQLHQRDGHLGGQLIVKPQVTGGEQLVDLLGDGFAHAGDLEQLALAPVFVDIAAQLGEAIGGFAVGEDLVDHLALDLEQVGDIFEDFSDLTVCELFGGHVRNISQEEAISARR